jgi:CHAD domain-containing protein
MPRHDTSELLLRLYNKRTASFLASLYRAAISINMTDIHKIRVNVKKINAISHLLEMTLPGTYDRGKHSRVFRTIFLHAGRVREIQLHLQWLKMSGEKNPEIGEFREWLKAEKKKESAKFLRSARAFDESVLESIGEDIKKAGSQSKPKVFSSVTDDFLAGKTRKIGKLLAMEDPVEQIHRIRKHLKQMQVIANLADSLRPDKKLATLIGKLDTAEALIGQWHDQTVFLDSLTDYSVKIKKNDPSPGIRILMEKLTEQNQSMLEKIFPSIRETLGTE